MTVAKEKKYISYSGDGLYMWLYFMVGSRVFMML